jgi:hypothetical protein
MCEHRHRVDAVGQRAQVVAPQPPRDLAGLPRVVQIADQQRDRRARQHLPVQQRVREPEHEPTQRVDEEELHEVVDREAEEPVDVAADEPAHARAV